MSRHTRSWRLGATSYVHPGGWAFNVERLAAEFQDIEILFFEGGPGSFPSANECAKLARLKHEHQLSYSLHTPLSASLASTDSSRRQASIETVLRALEAASAFEPEAAVLHVYLGDSEHDPQPPTDWNAWRERAWGSLERLRSVVGSAIHLCVESLDYDIEELSPVLEELDLSYALDIGHWSRDGRDTLGTLERLLPRTRLIQWHGTDPQDRDHRSLKHYPSPLGVKVLQLLEREQYRGVLTLEVFRPNDLLESLAELNHWQRLRGAR